LAQRIRFVSGVSLGRSPLTGVVDDTVDNDPYAGGKPRNSAPTDIARQSVASADTQPLDGNAVLAAVGDQISVQTRAKITALGPSPYRAAQVLGSPDFMRR
jgi:hypothetical protein